MNIDANLLDDDTKNELASNWFFLTMHANSRSVQSTFELFNELIETGLKLKAILRKSQFSKYQPMNVYVDTDTYFDIWIDSDDQIQTSDLYTYPD